MKNIKTVMLLALLMAGFISHAQNPLLKNRQGVITCGADTSQSTDPVAAIFYLAETTESLPGTNWNDPQHPNPIVKVMGPNWTVGQIGELFGIAINPVTANIYFGASDIYNQDNGSGGLGPVTKSGPAGRSGIYRCQPPVYLAVPMVTTIVGACGGGVGTNLLPSSNNLGCGTGDLAWDSWHNQIFVSNLEDGKIYRINPTTGLILSAYDPKTADNCSPIIAPLGERVWGVGVFRDEHNTTRLYFGLENAGPSEIYSVELTSAGEFTGVSAGGVFSGAEKLELTTAKKVTDIAFSSVGNMLVAERGNPHAARVYEYFGTSQAWSAPKLFAVGENAGNDGANAAGGVDYGFMQKSIDVYECDSLVWATSNYMFATNNNGVPFIDAYQGGIYGLEGINAAGNTVTNNNLQDIFIDFNQDYGFGHNNKTFIGDVEICRMACDSPGICEKATLNFEKAPDDPNGNCCWNVSAANFYAPNYFSGLQFDALGAVQISVTSTAPTWEIDSHVPSTAIISPLGFGVPIPLGPHIAIATVCLTNYTSTDHTIAISWLGPPQPPNDSVAKLCTIEREFICTPPQDPRCAVLENVRTECKDGKVSVTFDVHNNSAFTFQSLILSPSEPGVTVSPAVLDLSPGIAPNQTDGPFTVYLSGSLAGLDSLCFYLTAHDSPLGSFNPHNCCTDSVNLTCIKLPLCDPCDGVSVSTDQTQVGQKTCCHSITISNNYLANYFSGIQIVGLGGVQIDYVSGWPIVPPISASQIGLGYPGGGGIPIGTHPDIVTVCLNGFTSTDQELVIHWIGPDSTVECTDTLKFRCDPPPPPTCIVAVRDSIWCDGAQIKYTFSIQNATLNTFPVLSFVLNSSDPDIITSQTYFELTTAILPGQTAGPFTINLNGPGAAGGSQWCFYLTGHNNIIDTANHIYPTICCTDSVQVRCLTIPNCSEQCCYPNHLTLPTGISPNGDNLNDLYVIQGLDKCKKVTLTVYNRWGNIVFKKDNYNNTWGGTNQNGEDLPQGTYYILLTLHDSGSNMSGFVDVRRQ